MTHLASKTCFLGRVLQLVHAFEGFSKMFEHTVWRVWDASLARPAFWVDKCSWCRLLRLQQVFEHRCSLCRLLRASAGV